MSDTAKLTVGDQTIELETTVGTEGEKGIILKPLRKTTGYITLDPGFVNTGSAESSITYIDGENGVLRYRGYAIEELVENSTFLEVCYLLMEGELPNKSEYDEFEDQITNHTLLHEDLKRMFEAFPPNAHPMAILASLVCALSTYYQDHLDSSDPSDVQLSTRRLLAKLPTIAAWSYKRSKGQAYIYPDNTLDYCGRFLKMMFGYRTEEYVVDPDISKILDQLLILHADHEQNCSATAMRLVGSSHANLFACVSAAVCALWGPRHGGANQRVLEMLDVIAKDNNDVDKYVRLAQDKTSDFRLMGFGHRVYKSYDPRAMFLRKSVDRVLTKLNTNDPLVNVARRLEEHALNDSYFQDRNLYPNVDFYSGIIYRALNIPTNMFTVMFAMGRLPGWIAQWKENHANGYPIGRPRQIYTGEPARPFVSIDER
ncbi:MAG: citrate (Si)-synthase [Myxococcales bacterium]|nr:citrate (Si)-synthase [Myxococcales bacterium]